MNPLFLLLGLFGLGAMGASSSPRSTTTVSEGSAPPIVDMPPEDTTDGDMDMGGDDGGDDGGMDMGGDDGGDDGGMDMGGDDGGDDGGMDMGGDDGGTDDHHTPPEIAPPGVGASQSAIDAYISALAGLGEVHVHDGADSKAAEHTAAMNLVPRGNASHVAIGSGDWFDPSIWSNGEVPGNGADVLIPDGVTVNYAGLSDARLDTVRIDGTLDFATDTNSQMIFDTMVSTPTSHLIIGTANDPVQANVDIDLIVASNGPIDTNWDPMLLSRGIIAHGETTIHGAVKDSHEKVSDDPMAGDTSITFDSLPEGWQVGDTIVIAGTHYDGHSQNEDEVREITSIEGNQVFFEQGLAYNHDSPRDDLSTSVANYTRNVSIESEEGADAEIFERGHVMFMHSDDVDVRYAEFTELGRTDKSVESRPIDDFGQASFDDNVQGRYSLHLHRTGVSDIDDPAILEGNAVFGAPGWGVVHHDSNANLTNNATYDTFGSGFVAETGNETGIWDDNIAIFAEGINWETPKNTSDIHTNFDTGRGGEGFWLQGRMIEVTDNVAASVNVGFAYFHRDHTGTMLEFDAGLFEYSDALWGMDNVTADQVPITTFSGNETFAANEGIHVVKAAAFQGHDVWTHLDDFTGWSVITGVNLEYTSHYLLTEFDLIAKDPAPYSDPRAGIYLGNNMNEVVIVDATIDGFPTGIDLHKNLVGGGDPAVHQYAVVDAEITNAAQDFANYDPGLDRILSAGDLPYLTPDLDLDPMVLNGTNDAITISGTKSDSLGTVDFPGGLEIIEIAPWENANVINNYGYYTTSGGQNYTLLDIYFTDRLTGEVFYETHPVMLTDNIPLGTTLNGSQWLNVPFNGVEDFVTQNGVTMVGDRVLYEPIPAVPEESQTLSMMPESMDHSTMSMLPDETSFFLDDAEELTINEDEITLGTDATEVEPGVSKNLAVFAAAAKVGFDGNDGGIAILDMQEDETVSFSAADGYLGTIEELENADVQSGIDLGNASLSVDLTGLSADAGSAFTLMNADELVGLFDGAVVGGLGARDATITIDYANDSVTLNLIEGTGGVSVETVGQQEDVSKGYEALWDALTADQIIVEDVSDLDDEEPEEVLAV